MFLRAPSAERSRASTQPMGVERTQASQLAGLVPRRASYRHLPQCGDSADGVAPARHGRVKLRGLHDLLTVGALTNHVNYDDAIGMVQLDHGLQPDRLQLEFGGMNADRQFQLPQAF